MAFITPAFIWLVSLLVALIFTFYPNSVAAQNYNNREEFNQTYPLTANGRVSISNINGEIDIQTWERSEIKVEAVKIIEDCSRELNIEIKVDARPDALKIETEFPNQNWNGGKGKWNQCKKSQVDYKLTVPANVRLDEVESVNGRVKIVGTKGFVKASTVNGELIAQNLANSAELSTVNGTLDATFDRLEKDSSLKLNAVNGTIHLSIPSDAEATLKADTINGNIANDFGLPVKKGEYVGRNLYGRIGNGDASIKLSTVNGSIEIKRNNDGKNPKQVGNLLETKSVTGSGNPRNLAPALNAGIDEGMREGIREAQRASADALREAQRGLKEAQREMREAQRANSTENRREAEKALRDAQRELDQLQREMSRPPVAPIPPVAPVAFSFNENTGNAPFSERETKSLPLAGSQKLNIEGKDSRITVRGWDKAEVSYTLLKQAGNDNELKQIQAQTATVGNDVFLKIITPNNNRNWNYNNSEAETELEVFVPRTASLRINGSDGEIRVENMAGGLEISGSDGAIDVRDIAGNLKIKSSDGTIRVIGFNGAADVQSSDGNISLEGDFTALSARTSDGNIVLTLKDGTNAAIETRDEEISGDFAKQIGETKIWQIGNGNGAKFLLNTSDGKIIVRRQSAVSVQP